MSEPNLISPLLDGFLMGSPMSDHNGVQCCPAMKENSDHKYIVKIISIPASQKQLDALLLAGAYRKPEDAMDYFKELADGVVSEAQCLQELAKLEGFLPYENWQIVPLEHNELGYQVYLLGSYKRSLEKHMRRTMLTHLDAINLGIDMCSALAAVRRAGYMYLDLKPSNIFLTEEKSYRIGDLGFIALDAFRYTSLPGKYISRYTPPELSDPMATLNETADTYSLGMILYQIYNDGQLPAEPANPADGYPSPVNADYELAEIILKALAPKAEDRWTDPQEMGQALVSYMQRNAVNDTPVTPPSTVISDPEDIVKPEPENPEESTPEEPTLDKIEEDIQKDEAPADETMPTPDDVPQPDEDVTISEEVSKIVAHADDLISHETPKGVEVPDPDDFPDPFANFDPEASEDWMADQENSQEDLVSDPLYEGNQDIPQAPKKKGKGKTIAKATAAVVLLAALGAGGFYAYNNFYLQTIDDITVEGSQNELTVSVQTQMDQSLLTVVCIDAYGNTMRQPLVNGTAQFTELQSDSLYRIQLEVKGPHQLVGETSEIFNTEARTTIVDFNAVSGSEVGTVLLSFTTDGPEPSEWTLVYTADGEEPKRQVFSGHTLTLKNLTVDKVYTFYLETDGGTKVVGENRTLQFNVSPLVTAQNLVVEADGPSSILAQWEKPEGAFAPSWTVRCYDEKGFDQTLTVKDTKARFEDIDPHNAYTIEVTAEGMTQPVRATITANPIIITDIVVDDSDPNQLTISWQYSGDAPEGGWLLSYTMDGGSVQNIIPTSSTSVVVSPRIPDAEYHFQILAADGMSVFENTSSYTSPETKPFAKHSLVAASISARLTKTPSDRDWTASSLSGSDYTDTFASGDPISVVLHANQNFYIPSDEISALYVFRDGDGNAISKMVTKETLDWKDLWFEGDYHDSELDLPSVPTEPGKYSISIYFNGAFVASADFTITGEAAPAETAPAEVPAAEG